MAEKSVMRELRRKNTSASIFDALKEFGTSPLAQTIEAAVTSGRKRKRVTIDDLPEKSLINILSYLGHRNLRRCVSVCRKWRAMIYDPRMWCVVSFRPEYGGLQVNNLDVLMSLIGTRFAPTMSCLELPMELIQAPVLHELANKCHKLQYLTLDFSTAVQLHEFNDLQAFPARLISLTLCLSEVIFLEGFLRKIYSFIGSIQVLHLIGTYEKVEDEEEECYEVVNLHKLKGHVPNLRVVNLWGVVFITDDHIESLSANCCHIECLAVNFCPQVSGTSIKLLLQRCRKLKTLLMEQCLLDSHAVMVAEWEKSTIMELNISATDLSTEAIISVITRLPRLCWLSAGYLEHFNDHVLSAWIDSGSWKYLTSIDLNHSDSVNEAAIEDWLGIVGPQLRGSCFGGIPQLLEHFWLTNLEKLHQTKTLVMGMPETCCAKVTAKIHIDQFIECIASSCPKLERLEIRWDPETLRFSDRSSKFIDVLRLRCPRLRSLTLTDGQYFELVKSNFERSQRMAVVRTTTNFKTSITQDLQFYKLLLFN